MAGYRTSWHGMMVAFFGVFVVLALLVVDLALEMGVLGTSGRLVQLLPAVLGVALFQSAETFAFGGVLGVLIAVFAGWLGGLLAPARITAAATAATPAQPEVHNPRERFRLLPSAARKGGERMHEAETVPATEPTARPHPKFPGTSRRLAPPPP